jgi:hypothetical protein
MYGILRAFTAYEQKRVVGKGSPRGPVGNHVFSTSENQVISKTLNLRKALCYLDGTPFDP